MINQLSIIKRILSLLICLILGQSYAQKVEAEDGVLLGTSVQNTRSGFSGTGYVGGFDAAGDAVVMTIEVTSEGLYELIIGYAAPFGEKVNDIYVNDQFIGGFTVNNHPTFTERSFGKIALDAGENEIKMQNNWGWIELDYVKVKPSVPNDINRFSSDLINANATSETKIIYQYLSDVYGRRILSGQQSNAGGDEETNFLKTKTGKLPAIKGFDLMDYSPSRAAYGLTSNESELAIEWWQEQTGIVSLMWHWNAPMHLIDTAGAEWWRGFYTYGTTFDLKEALANTDSEEYKSLISDIDEIAIQLQKLADANVPVIWRPLHEAEGAWFWWGAKGAEACVELWKIMYERLTDHYHFNNLIWVWTGTDSESAWDWYPGDDYVDIVGADIYLDDKNYSSNFNMFDNMVGLHEGAKLISLSETGTIPDPEALLIEQAKWCWFMVWSGDFIIAGEQNDVAHINTVYNHEYVITLDELPDFDHYVSPEYDTLYFPVVSDTSLVNVLTINDYKANYIYPNPAEAEVRFLNTGVAIDTVEAMDVQGRAIGLLEVKGLVADVSDLPSGQYLLRVRRGDQINFIRMMKK